MWDLQNNQSEGSALEGESDLPRELLFISHSKHDAENARDLVAFLEEKGLICWIAPRDVVSGKDFNSQITAAIRKSQAVLLLETSDSTNSVRVRREINYAVDERIPVIPLTMEQNLQRSEAMMHLLSGVHRIDSWLVPIQRCFSMILSEIQSLLKLPVEIPRKDPNIIPEYIGTYRVLDLLGEGGMGSVFRAEQRHPIKRVVALKRIKLGMDSKEVLARFDSERQALARMEHPNIAKVFEAGSDELGRPFFVMEFVPGRPVTEYCDERRLSLEDRLRIFQEVCEAIGHAHGKAIIHRDIKPRNVLGYSQNDSHVVKIIDFGIAKATTADRLTDLTNATAVGSPIGSFEYMSPEQAEGSPDIDIRTDVYSLGVLLYELLSGVKPFDGTRFAELGEFEARQAIRIQDPPRPSQQLMSLRDKIESIAESRATNSDALLKRLKSELEWIPLQAMHKDRSQRYKSTTELSEDIQNYLGNRPLKAGPETWKYRGIKFVSRYAWPLVLAFSLFLLVTGGVFAYVLAIENERVRTTDALDRLQLSEREANAQRDVAQRALEEQRKQLDAIRIKSSISLREKGQSFYARDFLDLVKSNHRTAAWQLCRQACDGGDVVLYQEARGGVGHAAFSRDGRFFAIGNGPQIQIYNGETFELLHTCEPLKSRLLALLFRSDGEELLTFSEDLLICTWNLNSGKRSKQIKLESFDAVMITCASISPDGKRLLIATLDGKAIGSRWAEQGRKELVLAEIVDMQTGEKLGSLGQHNGLISSAAFSEDSKTILTSCWDCFARVWDVESRTLLSKSENHGSSVTTVSLHPNERTYATGADDGFVRVFDVATGEMQYSMNRTLSPNSIIAAMAFSPDGRWIASSGMEGTIKIWDTSQRRLWRTMDGEGGGTLSLVFSPDSQVLASGNSDDTAHIFGLANSERFRELHRDKAAISAIAFSSSGRALAIATQTREILLMDVESGRVLNRLTGLKNPAYLVSFDSSDAFLAAASLNDDLYLWSLATGERVDTSESKVKNVSHLSFVRNRPLLAAADRDGRYSLLGLNDQCRSVWKSDFPKDSKIVANPAGTRFALSSNNRPTYLYSLQTVERPIELAGMSFGAEAIEFDPLDKFLATSHRDQTLRVWDAKSGLPLAAMYGSEEPITKLAWSPDGRTLATRSKTNGVELWDWPTEQLLGSLVEQNTPATAIEFSSDGKYLATGGQDGLVRCWSTSSRPRPIRFGRHLDRVSVIRIDPFGTTIATGAKDGSVMLFQRDNGIKLASFQAGGGCVVKLAWSKDGKRLFATVLANSQGKNSNEPTSIDIVWDVASSTMSEVSSSAQDLDYSSGGAKFFEAHGYCFEVEAKLTETEIVRRCQLMRFNPDWHMAIIDDAETSGNQFVAAFHLKLLLARNPKDESLKARLVRAEKALATDKTSTAKEAKVVP